MNPWNECRSGPLMNLGMNFERTLMTGTLIVAVALAVFAAQPLPIAAPPAMASQASNELFSEPDFERIAFQDAQGLSTNLAATNGHVRLVTMFYSHCPGVCPATVESLRSIEGMLTPLERRRLRVVMLSLDTARDSSAALADFAAARQLDPQRWITGTPRATDLSTLSSGLGTTYEVQADGSIDHVSPIVLLAADGRVLARWNRRAGRNTGFLQVLRAALAAS